MRSGERAAHGTWRGIAGRRLEELTVDTCLDLLGTRKIGRLAFIRLGVPHVIPLTYVLHSAQIVFRTNYGTTIEAIEGRSVAFEVDAVNEDFRFGWSVVVHGRAQEVTQPRLLEALRALPLDPWAPGDRDHYVRILPAAVTGRRIT